MVERPVGRLRVVLRCVETQEVTSVVEIEGCGVLTEVTTVVLVAVMCDLLDQSGTPLGEGTHVDGVQLVVTAVEQDMVGI